MRVRVLWTTISVLATPLLLAASPPPIVPAPTASSFSEQPFMASVDRYFLMLAGKDGYITPAGLRAQTGSTRPPEGQPVPLPLSYTHFSCMDANKDGRISAEEYRAFARTAFELGSVNGVLNLGGMVKYDNALQTCAVKR